MPLFAMIARDKPGMGEQRAATRPVHLDHLKAMGNDLVMAGALMGADGNPEGSLLVLEAASLEAFDEIRTRLVERGSSDGFVTDFGQVLSLFFRDPDGLEAEVCVVNPQAQPGVHNPPGTPSPLYHGDETHRRA